jgi:AcrR family transcriptional regulator
MPVSTRKQELLDACIAYLLRHGIADLSLRPMAAEAGTSARLLIFHFGSKEQLLGEVLGEMQARLQRSFAELLQTKSDTQVSPLRMFWDWALARENFAYLRLLYQLHILATQNPKLYGRFLKRNSLNWLALIQAALPAAHRSPALATLFGAVFDGLFIELVSSGDRDRTTEALDEFIRLATEDIRGSKRPKS